MLVIRRRTGEALLGSGEAEVEVLEISGGQVKLGIRAPREVLILRKEVKITEEENIAASRSIRVRGLEADASNREEGGSKKS